MPRRKPDADTLDMFGFDPLGHAYTTTPDENRALLGRGVLALAVYHVIKRFAKGNGQVIAASYYRLAQVLAYRAEGPGRRPADPSRDELRGALRTLAKAGLILKPDAANEQRGVLQIWVANGVGGTSARSIDPGFKPGSRRAASRASA